MSFNRISFSRPSIDSNVFVTALQSTPHHSMAIRNRSETHLNVSGGTRGMLSPFHTLPRFPISEGKKGREGKRRGKGRLIYHLEVGRVQTGSITPFPSLLTIHSPVAYLLFLYYCFQLIAIDFLLLLLLVTPSESF